MVNPGIRTNITFLKPYINLTKWLKQYSYAVQKKNNNKNCSVSSLVSKNTIGVNVS